MNSPPSSHFHYYNLNFHDPTLVNVHTLLNPQPFKHHTPPSIPTFQSATTQYWASHPPFPLQQQTPPPILNPNFHGSGNYQNPWLHTQHSPLTLSSTQQQIPNTTTFFNHHNHKSLYQQSTYNSSYDTAWLLQQILQSQQALNHAISNLVSDLSTLNTSLPPSINTHNITKTQQHSVHAYTPLHHHVPECHTSPTQTHFITPKRDSNNITTIITECDFVVANEFSEPKIINESKTSHELMVVEDDFTHTIDLVSKVDEEEIKLVPDLVAISSNGSDFFEQKVDDVKDLNVSFSATTAPSTETKVVRAVAQTPEQHPRFTVELPALSIHVFDPGGTLTVAVNSAARRHQIQNSRIFTFRDSSATFVFDPGGTFTVTAGRSSHFCHPFEINKFRSFNFSCDSGIILVFDPGGDKCRFLSPVTVLFPARSATMNASSGRPWVPWSRKHKVPKGCIEVFDPEGASFVFRLEFPIATLCQDCFKVRRNHTTKWPWCFWLIIGLCVHIGLAVKRKKKPTQQICFQHRNSQN